MWNSVASRVSESFRRFWSVCHIMAAATKCLAPFFHVSVRNADGDNLDRSQWEVVANSVERMLGLTDQPRAVAFHTAEDTGHAHMHIAWSRINEETLTAKPLPFFKQRLKQVCRELEERFGLTPVPNERRSSIRFAPTRAESSRNRRDGCSLDVHVVARIHQKLLQSNPIAVGVFGMRLRRKGWFWPKEIDAISS